ncbi:unnamed protein product [Mytilus edulis]|uniref:Uncharacterized protein n=1 Tax=Mytilus edulis TaxID=6550 RepID=A0A8S3Q2R6_MYTED|nr:unnamed protein product [Mytilus edulis]
MKIFKDMQDDLHTVTQHTLQFFLGVHQIGRKVLEYQRCVEDIENNDMANVVDIKIKQIGEIQKILSVLESLKSFGEVEVSKSDVSIKREINGKLQKQLPIFGEAWIVTQISKNTIAITYPYDGIIKIFNIEDEIMIKVIKLHNYCCGISFFNESLAVGLGSKAVYCINESGKQIWQYEHDLEGPRGLRNDTFGNVIVADYKSNKIIAISKDGQDSKVLVRQACGLDRPMFICLRNDLSSGFVCDGDEKYFAKFNLSYN